MRMGVWRPGDTGCLSPGREAEQGRLFPHAAFPKQEICFYPKIQAVWSPEWSQMRFSPGSLSVGTAGGERGGDLNETCLERQRS